MSTTQPRAWGPFSGQRYGSFASKTTTLAAVPVRALPSWYYTPGPIPMDAQPWILRELQAISQSTYGAAPFMQLQAQYAAPSKLHDGMVVRAKSPWDPGSGDGVYYYDDDTAAWIKLG